MSTQTLTSDLRPPTSDFRPPTSDLVAVAPGVYLSPDRIQALSNTMGRLCDKPRRWRLIEPDLLVELGLGPEQNTTLMRLWWANEITIAPISPRLQLLDMISWNSLLDRCKADPWYWEDRKRLERYRGTYS